MEALLTALAVGGVAAILLRLIGSLLGLGLVLAERSAARTLAEASARRGDLTGMMEGREVATALTRRRARAWGWVAAWAGVLLVPPLLGAAQYVYAAAAALWALPRPRVRRVAERPRS